MFDLLAVYVLTLYTYSCWGIYLFNGLTDYMTEDFYR